MARSPEQVDRAMRRIVAEGEADATLVEDLLRSPGSTRVARSLVTRWTSRDRRRRRGGRRTASTARRSGDRSTPSRSRRRRQPGTAPDRRQPAHQRRRAHAARHHGDGHARAGPDGNGEACGARLVVSDDGPGMATDSRRARLRALLARRTARGPGRTAHSVATGSGCRSSPSSSEPTAARSTLDTAPGAGATFTVTLSSPPDVDVRSGQERLIPPISDPGTRSAHVPSQ